MVRIHLGDLARFFPVGALAAFPLVGRNGALRNRNESRFGLSPVLCVLRHLRRLVHTKSVPHCLVGKSHSYEDR